ncbi:MAG: hypothetical protein LIO59_01045 [Oscillospiraceae bacterium]|nr:hypothetical protein [Oscillospiraceae bacterium]
MNKFENVEIIPTLERIMRTNTEHFQSDFEIDKEIITKAANDKDTGGRLLWMSRQYGTHCFTENDVYIKNTYPHNTWTYYGDSDNSKMLAYAVKITEVKDGHIYGNLYELDYQKHYRHILDSAVQADKQAVNYKGGIIYTKIDDFFPATHHKYGEFINRDYLVVDRFALSDALNRDHTAYEKLKSGDIEAHINRLETAGAKRRIKGMTAEERQEIIDTVELVKDYGEGEALSDFELALYDAAIAECKKPSIRKQLAESKEKVKPAQHTPKKSKEDIAL